MYRHMQRLDTAQPWLAMVTILGVGILFLSGLITQVDTWSSRWCTYSAESSLAGHNISASYTLELITQHGYTSESEITAADKCADASRVGGQWEMWKLVPGFFVIGYVIAVIALAIPFDIGVRLAHPTY